MIREGVPYHPFIVTFRTKDGARHHETHYSPGFPWVRTEVARSIDERIGVEQVVPGTCVIQQRRRK